MGKASITIAVNAKWNGDQLARAERQLERLATLTAASTRSVSSDLVKQGAGWAELGGKIYNAGTKMAQVGDMLTRNVTTPIVNVGTMAAQSAIQFDTAMANVRKTSDMTDEQIEKLAQSALELSKTQPVTADTILNIEALGSQLGVSNDKLESFAKTVSGLDIATDMDFETAGKQMAQFANITSMSEDEFSNYASTIVDLGNNLATTESDISNMSLRLAGLTSTANFSQAEIMGMAGAMSSLGINAEAGGSAMTQIVAQISKSVESGGDSIEAYARVAGTSAEEFAAKWKSSPMEALEMVVQGIHNLDESGQGVDTTLSELGITSIRQADVMRRLAGNTDTLKNAVDRANTAWGENTALTNEVNSRNESLESRIQVLKNKLEAIAITVGRPLVEAVISATDALQPFIDFVGNLAQEFANADTGTQQMILGFVGVAAAAGPVLSVLGRITQVVGTGVTAFGNIAQKVGTYTDALLSVDGAQIRNYDSANTMAANLGLVQNKAVQAAGGAKNYVSAWEGMNTAAKNVGTLQGKIESAAEKTKAAASRAEDLALKAAEADAKLAGFSDSSSKAATAAQKAADKAHALSDKANAAAQSAAELESNLRQEAETAQKSFEKNASLVSSWSKSTTEAEKAAKGISKLEDAVSDEAGVIQKAATGTTTFAAAAEEGAVTTAAAGTAATGASTGFLAMAGSVLAASAPLIAITAVTALVTAAVTQWAEEQQKAKEHTELMANATRDMSDIMAGATSSVGVFSSSIAEIEVDADSTSQALADLNDSVRDTFTEVSTNSGKLDAYVSTIQDLAGKSDLSATQQYRLKEAVEGYNEVCGTSYEVTKDAGGAFQVVADGAAVSAQKLAENADAWKKNAEASAYSQMATKYLEIQLEAQSKLADAEAKYSSAKKEQTQAQKEATQAAKEYNEETQQMGVASAETTKKFNNANEALSKANKNYDDAKDAVKDLKADINSAGKSYEYMEAAAAASGAGCDQAAQRTAGSIAQSLASMKDKAKQALSDTGISTSDLAVKLTQAGVSSENMSNVSSSAFALMASSCGGDIDTLVSMIQQYNTQKIDGKTGEIHVEDGQLVDAQGRILEWNNGQFVPKETTATVSGNATDGTAETKIKDTKAATDGLADKNTVTQVDGNVTSGDAKDKTDKAKASTDSLADKLTTTQIDGNVTSGDAKSKTDAAKKSVDNLSPKTVPVTASGNVISGVAKNKVDSTKKSIDNTNGKDVTVSAKVKGKSDIDNLRSSIAGLASKTVNIFANVFKNNAAGGIRLATGGIRTHADGGVVNYAKRYHAHGNIVNNPGAGVPLDIVGEAGAEAIVPLTNKRYSKPFARTIAEQMGETGVKLGGGNTYVLNINGIENAATERSKQLLEALFDEYQLTNQMGVY